MKYESFNKTFNTNDNLIKELALKNPKDVMFNIRKMSLSANKDFEAKINGKTIFIKENSGFEMDYNDPSIKEFIVLSDNVVIYTVFTYDSRSVN